MKKVILYSLLGLGMLSLGACSSQKTVSYNYEMVCQGVGLQGSNLVKVYSYAGTAEGAIKQAKKDAVHGVLFKGIVGGNGCSPQPPIVSSEELNANRAFFDNFFKNDYERYVNLSSDGSTSPKDRLKVGSQYKVGVVVSVNKNELRRYLESQNIIKKLGHIFD